jgi:hypothetical protein
LNRFTVISFFTPDFAHFACDLRADCERFGYPCRIEEVAEAGSLTETWDRKVEFIGESIRRLGTVLWLDVECRLLAPIPVDWAAPLTSTFPMGNSRPVSTGVLMLDRSHLPLMEVWGRHARKHADLPDDFVLEFLLGQYDLPFTFVETEFFDRRTPAQIVRGQWETEGTIVQHPTINRWPDPMRYARTFNGPKGRSVDADPEMRVARKRKSLFWRNFGGDFEEVERMMASDSEQEHVLNGWVFDPAQQEYAPLPYWPSMPEIFGVKPLTRAKFREHAGKGFQENPFRRKVLRSMRLERMEKTVCPLKKPRFFGVLKP